MSTVTEIKNGQPATMAQQVYINDLYNQLEVGYLKRQKPQTVGEASILIEELKRQVWDESARGAYE